MKAVLLQRHGGPEVLRVRELPEREPGLGEVRVRLDAIGVNFAEVLSRKGLYGWAPPLPYVPGMEGTGSIDAVGPGVTSPHVGERVIAAAQCGAYAEQITVPAAQALPALADFTVEENAAFAVNALAAWVALVELARLRPGDRVLVTAAGGGVGTAAVQIAGRFGCSVVALAGSAEKLSVAMQLGAVAGVNYRERGFERRLREAAGAEGVDVALELVGGAVQRAIWPVLAPFGRLVVAGFASLALQRWNPLSWWRTWRDLPRRDIRELARGSHGLLATHLGYLLADPPRLTRIWRDLTAFATAHRIRPVIAATLPFPELAAAHQLLESRRTIGKVVVRL